MKRIKLKNITKTTSGYSFRQAVRDEGRGVRVVHISDFKGLYIDMETLKRTTLKMPSSQLLKAGDVILSSRGYFKAVVFKSKLATVASLSAFVIRPQSDKVLPEYLAICLNSAKIQNYLEQIARGSIMRSIRLKDLLEVEIPIIDLEEQKTIVKLIVNLEEQSYLLENKQQLLSEIHHGAIQKQLQGVNE